jgi:hypothetical protein
MIFCESPRGVVIYVDGDHGPNTTGNTELVEKHPVLKPSVQPAKVKGYERAESIQEWVRL